MKKVYIVDGVRLPVGAFGGFYRNQLARDLGATVIKELVQRTGINPNEVDEVVVGNIIQTDDKGNPGREAWLSAGMPIEVPAYTINMNCASGSKAIAMAATSIMAGEAEMVVAVGMDSMSNTPYALRQARYGYRMGDGVLSDLLTDLLVGMGMTAERLAERHHMTREEIDAFAVRSQQNATKAWANHEFDEQIVPFTYTSKGKEYTLAKDEGFKPETTLETLAKLRPTFKKDGIVTAGNSSTINDCAAAVLVVSEEKLAQLGKKPLLEIVGFTAAGVDPLVMGIGPVPAVQKLLAKTGLTVADIDVWELNEAFASQALAVIKELGLEPYMDRINPNGSGISLGHPVGATGAILTTKIAYHMRKNHLRYGIVTMCVGGGQGFALLVKNPNV
jgi:acetyl-CoA C-acetyltransferase